MQSPENVFSFHNALTNCFSLAINSTIFFTSRLCHRNVHQTRFDIRRVSISRLFPYLLLCPVKFVCIQIISIRFMSSKFISIQLIYLLSKWFLSQSCLSKWFSSTLVALSHIVATAIDRPVGFARIGRCGLLRGKLIFLLFISTTFASTRLIYRGICGLYLRTSNPTILSQYDSPATDPRPLERNFHYSWSKSALQHRDIGFAGLSSQSTASNFFFQSLSLALPDLLPCLPQDTMQ